jgi:hypothetical protein
LKPRSAVSHLHNYIIRCIGFRPDQQLSIADLPHRFHGIDDQVQHDLLELDSISLNDRQTCGQLDLL